MCGEQPGGFLFSLMVLGSPPRVRGTAAPIPFLRLAAGITPACAGNSAFGTAVYVEPKDHPRVCGEQAITAG